MLRRLGFFVLALLATARLTPAASSGTTSVWKVSAPDGRGTLYLAGSSHALRATDYPLPAAFNRAFDLSDALAMEVSPADGARMGAMMEKRMMYPPGQTLREHVDPRTWEYLRRIAVRNPAQEAKLLRMRPWAVAMRLEAPGQTEFSGGLGLESYFRSRAVARRKPTAGLASLEDHVRVFSGLSDRDAEAVLLVTLINHLSSPETAARGTDAWRRGDVEETWRVTNSRFRDFPAMGDRLLGARNRAWIPHIERWLRSGRTWMVLAGAAHMGGPDGGARAAPGARVAGGADVGREGPRGWKIEDGRGPFSGFGA